VNVEVEIHFGKELMKMGMASKDFSFFSERTGIERRVSNCLQGIPDMETVYIY
jgi:hypothetical protein